MTCKPPCVSIIVPNYNHAQYLRQRIDSILNQTYTDFELILLDDCSKDSSIEILLSYKDNPKVSNLFINEQNSGSVFRQWQKGIGLSKGEYVWIAESDDWADEDLLTNLVEILDHHPTVGLVSSDSVVHQKSLTKYKLISEYLINKYTDTRWANNYIHEGKDEIREIMIKTCSIGNVSSVLFRKSVLLAVNPFDIPLRYSGDWYCYLKVATVSDIAYLAKPMNHFRRHASSTSFFAGYNYLVELFLIYNWLLSTHIVNDESAITNAFHGYITEVYNNGLKWNPIKDVRLLFPMNSKLYFKMTLKLLRRKIRSKTYSLFKKTK